MTDQRAIPRAYTKEERKSREKFDALLHGQRAKIADGTYQASREWSPPVSPLLRFIEQSYGAPAETADRGDPAMEAGWLRLTDRQREECESPIPQIKQAAQRLLRSYVEASTDPDSIGYDPVQAHFIELAKAAPQAAGDDDGAAREQAAVHDRIHRADQERDPAVYGRAD
jgi:hypothetical protein